MKRKLFFAFFISFVFICAGCSSNLTDSEKFKKEYESLNGEKIENNIAREVSIDSDNPFIYSSAEEIVTKIDNKDTFAVYFGFKECPWCRSVIESLISSAKDLGLEEIYYVDIKDIRDTLKVDDNKNVVTEKKGTDGYYKLLEKLDNVLDEYSLESDDESINTNEKRIYAPTVVAIVNGNAEDKTTGISEKQDNAYMKLTKKMKKESYNKFKCVLECVTKNNNTCSLEKQC